MGAEADKGNVNIRLCVVSPLYHPSLGGLGRQALLLTERVAREGADVIVIARAMKGMPKADYSPGVKVYRAWSVKPSLHNYEAITLMNTLISLSFSISCAVLLFRRRNEYDVVHFHGASLPLVVTLPLLKALRKKVIAKVAAANIGTEAGSLRGRFCCLGNLFIKLLKKVDAFIATSSEIEEGLIRDGFPTTRVIRITNFIDTAEYTPAPAEEKVRLKKELGFRAVRLVTFSGRFVQRKGVQVLLLAWKAVIRDVPDARLALLGDGPLLDDMMRRAAQLGLTDSVAFQGHVSNTTNVLRASDIFVLPSLQEGMPNSLLEAMACGLPPVATRIGGVVDIITHGENGIVVEPGDPDSLARGIVQLLTNKTLLDRIASHAFKTATEFYSLDGIAPRYMKLYGSL